MIIVNGWKPLTIITKQPLTIITKRSILDVAGNPSIDSMQFKLLKFISFFGEQLLNCLLSLSKDVLF